MEQIKIDKFSDHTLSLKQILPLDEKTITVLNLLVLMTRGRSEQYPSRDAYVKAMNHAYGMKLLSGLSGLGANVVLETRIKYLRNEFVEDAGYVNEILNLADQGIRHPLFTEEILQEAKYLLKNRMIAQMENPESLAVMEAMKIAEPGSTISIPVNGIFEQIDDIRLDQIKALWEELKKIPYQIITVGNIDERVVSFLNGFNQTAYEGLPAEMLSVHEPSFKTIEKQLSQSSLAQVYATQISPYDPESPALSVMNAVLGSAPMSLLFEEIREKHSYCYSISSSLIRFSGGLVIVTGTNRENLDHVRELIQKQIETLQEMKFSKERFEAAKLDLLDGLHAQQDQDYTLIAQKFTNTILKRNLSLEQIEARIKSVTMEDVAKAARKLHLVSEAVVLQKENDPEDSNQKQNIDEVILEKDGKTVQGEINLSDLTASDSNPKKEDPKSETEPEKKDSKTEKESAQ